MTGPEGSPNGYRRAWGWVEHLRAGGTTPWSAWAGLGPERGSLLPGAQQLELLRRVNEVRRPGAALAESILIASAPGRGRPDLELAGVSAPSRFGMPPVDPSDLPVAELLRVATGVLAEALVATAPIPPAVLPRARPWRTRYRIVGDPMIADPLRTQLALRGHPPHGSRRGRRPVVLVVGAGVEQMIADAFTANVLDTGSRPWRQWVASLASRDILPPRADLATAARTWTERVGRDRVHLVLDPDAVPGLVGVRRPLSLPAPLGGTEVELIRQVHRALALLVAPSRSRELLRVVLRPYVEAAASQAGAHGREPLVVPPPHREWLQRRAERLHGEMIAAGYPVHGDPASLLAAADPAGTTTPGDGILWLAIRTLLGIEKADIRTGGVT